MKQNYKIDGEKTLLDLCNNAPMIFIYFNFLIMEENIASWRSLYIALPQLSVHVAGTKRTP